MFCLSVVAVSALAQPQVTLRVGVYSNAPKIFLDEEGRISGILGDMLNTMAERENWVLEPVACVWQQCLDWLEAGRLDLMPDVALTDRRSERFDFHQTPALLSWSQIYEARGERLSSLLDLADKRLAVMAGSVQESYLTRLSESFALNIRWVPVESLGAGFQKVADGEADAVAVNYFFGSANAPRLGLHPAPIMFQPAELYYAAPVNRHAEVLATIDRYLQAWREDANSPYFQILRRWSLDQQKSQLPSIVWWVGGILLLAFLLLLGFSELLRRKVAEKTRHLGASEARLNTILDSVEASIYIKDLNLRYQYVNRKACDVLGLSKEQILGRTDEQFFDARSSHRIRLNDQRVIEQGDRIAEEEVSTLLGESRSRIMLSAKLPLYHSDGSIYALCGISTDITEHRQIQEQLHQLAYFDPLTGLANRRLLLDRLQHALASRVKTDYEGALLLIDLDDFKNLNDTLGHESGDLLLQQLARRLEVDLRSTDMPARLGADEFVMILEDLSPDPGKAFLEARNLGQQLLERLGAPYDLNGHRYVASASIGVVMFSDGQGSLDALLKGADLALHAAKSAGRNTLRFFNPAMQTEVNRRTLIETALRSAIQRNELQLHVQPQVTIEGKVFGMEALVRWEDPELGRMSPGDFIPVAEACGLILPLGKWVLERACWTLAEWAFIPGMEDLTLAVNISPEQFRAPDFVTHLEDCIRRECINPALLELEVTESLLIDDMESTIGPMLQLRAQGIRFSLDDFGTGYASLSYLKRLPLSQLKIDQSFVRDLLTDANDEAIVRTIIALGQSLDLKVIAEGVETNDQALRLQELGCEAFQGYYFGRPESISTWEGRLSGTVTE